MLWINALNQRLSDIWARFEWGLSEVWASFERGLSKIWARFEQGSANKCHSLYSLDIGIGTIGIVISLYEKCHIGILSVSADKKIEFIGIGRYEKKLIGRTLGTDQLLIFFYYTYLYISAKQIYLWKEFSRIPWSNLGSFEYKHTIIYD